MRVVLGLAVWALSLGMTYLVGDIAYSSDINKYMDSTNLVGAYIIGSLVIALVYSLWYILRKEQRILDIVVPVTVLLGWGLARRKLLYAGGKGMVYSIAYDLKKVYGIKTGLIDLDYVSVSAVTEFVLFIVAVSMFFATYMIYRCNSLMIAIGLAFLFMLAGSNTQCTCECTRSSAYCIVTYRGEICSHENGTAAVGGVEHCSSCDGICRVPCCHPSCI